MFRSVSVKKLFILLLAAIIALLLLFFLHGPFLNEGVEDAVARALLERADASEEGDVPAEGHKIFQVTENGDTMQVWGVFRTGVYRPAEGGAELAEASDAVPARLTFEKKDGDWVLTDYREPSDPGLTGKDMKEIFPWHLRPFAAMTGVFEGGLQKQMEAYAGG